MNRRTYPILATLLTLPALAPQVQADERTSQAPIAVTGPVAARAVPQSLTPAQLTAIRVIGRNVLAAKKSGAEDPADAEQLERLRGTLDTLIAADLDPQNRSPITVQGQETGTQRRHRERVAALRESARADARAMAAQLRGHGEVKAAHALAAPAEDTRSAGLPVGTQRARLFERWSAKLDAALAEDNPDRTARLVELRDQLRATKGGVIATSVMPATPTLQVMPAGYVPPKAPTDNDGAAKE